MKHLSFLFGLALIGIILLAYLLNRVAVDLAMTEVFGALFVGVKILFFAGVVLGSAWVVIEIKRHSQVKVVGPGRHGMKQAIIHNGQIVHLNQPNQVQLDPIQQLAFMQKVIQMNSQMSKLAQQTQVQEVESNNTREIAGPSALPTNINYEDIRRQVPKNHILVGIGRKGIETKERAVGACLWIVGLSGTGKTSTTVLRVEERASAGHSFLGVDPHWFKPDSLTNAIKAYRSRFLMPMAQTPEETNTVFKAFMAEFQARKAGLIPQPWKPITLLVDEVGALMDPTNEIEEENAKMLPSIARVCGQEARNFEMGGIFISQQATGLAWLRKVALMVIVHQLLQESEKRLATNNDTAAMLDMKTWPIGRTYVFGVGFQEGPRTVQQPRFEVPQIVEAGSSPTTSNEPELPTSEATEQEDARVIQFDRLAKRGAVGLEVGQDTEDIPAQKNSEEEARIHRVAKMMAEEKSVNWIIKEEWGIANPGGAYQAALIELRKVQKTIAHRAIAG